jgi:hypothetical protein
MEQMEWERKIKILQSPKWGGEVNGASQHWLREEHQV